MHKYRRQAKYAAWYSNDDDSSLPSGIKNPFRKARTQESSSHRNDLEDRAQSSALRTHFTNPENDGRSRFETNESEDSSQIRRISSADARLTHEPEELSTIGRGKRTSSFHDSIRKEDQRKDDIRDRIHELQGSDVNEKHHEIIDFSEETTESQPNTIPNRKNKDTLESSVIPETGGDDKSTHDLDASSKEKSANILKKLFRKKSRASDDSSLNSKTESDKGAKKRHFTPMSQLRATLLNSWLNLLFLFVPAGFAVNYANANAATVFSINFIAIIPSTMMISYAVEELALRFGELLGALLSITFSNATQFISSVLLLRSNQILVLKTSLLGSMISNLLLMTGSCFFFGGINRIEQAFNSTVAQTVSMMLLLAILSLVVPTASHLMVSGVTHHDIVVQSRGTSIIILLSYILYLFFQLKTHTKMFNEPSAKNPKRNVSVKFATTVIPEKFRRREVNRREVYVEDEEFDEEPEEPQLSFWVAVACLVIATVLIAFNAEFATGSIQTMVRDAGISQTFVGFVILPILSNDPESIFVAIKDKLDLCLILTLEKCMQTALLIVPLIVLIAWCMSNEEMTLEFDGFSVSALFASIIIVAYVIQDGRSNWLVGALLIKVYVIVALAAYFVR